MHSLPLFIRLQGRSVILIGDGDAADAKRRLLERAGAVVTDDPLARVALAFVAIEDDAEAIAVADVLKSRGLLVNVVDKPDLCDFTTPAIVDRDPVIIAIGTGGASAGLAKAVRQRIEAMLPPALGQLANGLFAARGAMRTRRPDGSTRRRAIDAALAPGGVLDPMSPASADAVAAWLADGSDGEAARVAHIAICSPDPDDLTLRQARLLGTADMVVHTADVPHEILVRARADAVRIAGTTLPQDAEGLVVVVTLRHCSRL